MREDLQKLKRNIFLLYIFNTCHFMHFCGAVIVLFFSNYLKLTYTEIFLTQTVFSLSVFLFEVPTGVIADRFGRKNSLLIGTFFSISGWNIISYATNFYWVVLGEITLACAFSLFSGADRALLYDSLKKLKISHKSDIFFSRLSSFTSVGIIVGTVVGALITDSNYFSYPEVLALTVTMTSFPLVINLIACFMMEEPEMDRDESHSDEKSEKSIRSLLNHGINGFKYIFSITNLKYLSLNYVFISSATFYMFFFYQSLGKEIDIPIKYLGIMAAVFNLTAIFFMVNLQNIKKVISERKLLFLTAFIPGILYIGLYFSFNMYYFLLATIIIPSFKISRKPLMMHYINSHIQSSNRATVLSGINMLDRLLIGLMNPFIGFLADIKLNYSFLFLGSFILISILISSLKVKYNKIDILN